MAVWLDCAVETREGLRSSSDRPLTLHVRQPWGGEGKKWREMRIHLVEDRAQLRPALRTMA